MRVLVISDTHIPLRAKTLPRIIYDEIERADLIIHAGDFTSPDIYYELRALKPIKAVFGNMDDPKLLDILKEVETFELEGLKVGLFHGLGPPVGLEERVLQKLSNYGTFDLIIYGHSHRASYKMKDGVHILNPGSPTDTVFASKRTYAILEIDGKDLDVQIKTID